MILPLHRLAPAALVLAMLGSSTTADAQSAADGVLSLDLPTAISRLSSLDYATRMNAARAIRRADGAAAAEALIAAVKDSTDQFVRYRALVLLSGFADRRTAEVMRAAATDRNDRMREVAYRWMAIRPQEVYAPTLLAALQTEQAEFVRPALVRALAALGGDPLVQRALIAEVGRGQDFFRIGVIDALGEFKATYAREAITAVVGVDGPLQDDAVLALGRIGDRRAEQALVSLTMPSPEVGLALQAAYCLLGSECEARIRAIAEAMESSTSRPEVARSAANALTVLAASGSDGALAALAALSRASRVRETATVALGGVALRTPDRFLAWLAARPSSEQGELVERLRAAFERFEEDFAEEQFFAAVRAAYWREAEGSASRDLMAQLIQKLEF